MENMRKLENWSRKYNTQIVGVLKRKAEKQVLADWKNTIIGQYNRWKQTHRKLIVKFRRLGTEKILQVLGRKKKKGQVENIKNQNSLAFQLQHWEIA